MKMLPTEMGDHIKEINNSKISSRLRQAVVLMVVIFIGILISLITES